MPNAFQLEFAPFSAPAKNVLIVFCEEGLKFGSAARQALLATGDLVTRAAAAARFKGKNGSTLELLVPTGLTASRLIVVGVNSCPGCAARKSRTMVRSSFLPRAR